MFYAVKKGHKTGVFESWNECLEATAGFPGNDFKKFNTKEEAECYLEDRDIWTEKVAEDNQNGYLVAFTDGSYEKDLKRYSYGVVIIRPDGTEENLCGYGSNERFVESNNIIGEIFGVINALDWAVSNDYSKVKIYHDYNGLSKWISGEWKANVPASQMLVNLYTSKYEGILEVAFELVPGHSNISYNEKADSLANSALFDRKRMTVQGDQWYSIPYFSQDDFEAFSQLIEEADSNIKHTVETGTDKLIYRFKCNKDSVTVTLFKSGSHKLLVQGKNTYLFQVIASAIVELDDDSKVEQILGSAYRITIKDEIIGETVQTVENGLPSDYPLSVKRLVKQAIINLKYYIESDDYSQYVFPALKALEGHIKYMINKEGGTAGRTFSCFNRNTATDPYFYTGTVSTQQKKDQIELCYNYYKAQRDTIFHFGDMIGVTDSTRFINTKEEADEIINKCLELINYS